MHGQVTEFPAVVGDPARRHHDQNGEVDMADAKLMDLSGRIAIVTAERRTWGQGEGEHGCSPRSRRRVGADRTLFEEGRRVAESIGRRPFRPARRRQGTGGRSWTPRSPGRPDLEATRNEQYAICGVVPLGEQTVDGFRAHARGSISWARSSASRRSPNHEAPAAARSSASSQAGMQGLAQFPTRDAAPPVGLRGHVEGRRQSFQDHSAFASHTV